MIMQESCNEKETNEEGLKNKGMGSGILHVSSRM